MDQVFRGLCQMASSHSTVVRTFSVLQVTFSMIQYRRTAKVSLMRTTVWIFGRFPDFRLASYTDLPKNPYDALLVMF